LLRSGFFGVSTFNQSPSSAGFSNAGILLEVAGFGAVALVALDMELELIELELLLEDCELVFIDLLESKRELLDILDWFLVLVLDLLELALTTKMEVIIKKELKTTTNIRIGFLSIKLFIKV